jgi:NAD(P)H-dependent flavin oxidoreductase YrpB (nitropropane dioxygenase family)
MGWVAGARLTAATSAAGGLGVLATATMSFEEFERAIQRVKGRTSNPFGVNFRADLPDLSQRIELTIAQQIPIVSFAGPPTKEAVVRLHEAGIRCMSTVGARRHAEKVVAWGVDAVIAQGGEGGGHTGSVPTSILVPQVVDAVGAEVPVLAAGGIHDGRGLLAALAWGAEGVAMGTRFLLTAESHVPDAIKARYLETGIFDTVVTTSIDGRPQRVIRTPVIDRLERAFAPARLARALRSAYRFRKIGGTSLGELTRTGRSMHRDSGLSWSQVLMAANAPMLTKEALVEGRDSSGILPTGQVVGVIDKIPTVAEVIENMVSGATASFERITTLLGQ